MMASRSSNAGLIVRVARRQIEAEGVCSYELVADDHGQLPPFEAGAHIDVQIPGGLTRQYSLCNPPSERHRYLIAVLKDPGTRGGSKAMHERVHSGQLLRVSLPKNHFKLNTEAKRTFLLAGGIGVTPLLAMAEHLSENDAAFEMHYCCKTEQHAAFRRRIEESSFADKVMFHFDDGLPAQPLDCAKLLEKSDRDSHLYVCGPTGFMSHVTGCASKAGWPTTRVHQEFFVGDLVASDIDSSFEIEFAKSQRVFLVSKEQTALDALTAVGVEIPSSCEQGVCGTCILPVLSGIPDHRDSFLTPTERERNNQFAPCCSRAHSARLVLDL